MPHRRCQSRSGDKSNLRTRSLVKRAAVYKERDGVGQFVLALWSLGICDRPLGQQNATVSPASVSSEVGGGAHRW